jgi:hypothetical protein
VSDPFVRPPGSADPAGPKPFPSDYPYGSPAPDSPALLSEPGSGSAQGDRPTSGPAVYGTPPPYGRPPVPPPPYAVVHGQVPGFAQRSPEQAAVRSQAIAAVIVGVLLAMPCFNVLTVPAVIIAAIALGQVGSNLVSARRLTRVAWVWIAVTTVLYVAFMIFSVMLPGSSTST